MGKLNSEEYVQNMNTNRKQTLIQIPDKISNREAAIFSSSQTHIRTNGKTNSEKYVQSMNTNDK